MLIGFTGPMGCGKSYAAKYLRDRHRFTIHKMAGPLKRMIRTLGLTDKHIEGSEKEVPHDLLCGKTPRYAMQTLGTEWGRDIIGTDFWVNLWAFQMPGGRVVCDDVRFANEAAIIQKLGGTLVSIERDISTAWVPTHASEAFEGIRPDLILYNPGNEDFMANLDLIVGRMIEEQTNAND